jgi:hypothetical protein
MKHKTDPDPKLLMEDILPSLALRDRLYTSRHLSQILKLAGIVPKNAPSVAVDLATILQELHYLLVQGLGEVFKGVRKVFYSLDAWAEKLPWLNRCTIRRRMLLLQEAGLIEFAKEKANKCWHIQWYSLNYSKLSELLNLCVDVSSNDISMCQVVLVDVSTVDIHIKDNSTYISHSDLSVEEREKEKTKKTEMTNSEIGNEESNQSIESLTLDSTEYLSKEPDNLKQAKNSAPPLENQTKLLDSHIAKKAQSQSYALKERRDSESIGGMGDNICSWLPNGPWLIDGKLNESFRDWLAKEWMERYGGTIHQRRADVLRHFRKDRANLSIRWEQYSSEYLNRYQNAALRLKNGLEIKPDEQSKLITHVGAIVNQLSQQILPVAKIAFIVEAGEKFSLPPEPEPEPSQLSFASKPLEEPESVAEVSPKCPQFSRPNSSVSNVPEGAENVAAYQEYKIKPLNGQKVSLEELRAVFSKLKRQ